MKNKKKAQLEMEQIVKLIIILAVIALVALGIFLLRGKLGNLLENIRDFLRFGG